MGFSPHDGAILPPWCPPPSRGRWGGFKGGLRRLCLAVSCCYFLPGWQLPSQPNSITALWPIPNYTECVNNCQEMSHDSKAARTGVKGNNVYNYTTMPHNLSGIMTLCGWEYNHRLTESRPWSATVALRLLLLFSFNLNFSLILLSSYGWFINCTLCKHSELRRTDVNFIHTAKQSFRQGTVSRADIPKSQKVRISNVKSIFMPCCCLTKLRPMNHLLAYFSLHFNTIIPFSFSIMKMILNISITHA